MIEVLAVDFWKFGGGIMADNKQMGQVTKCRWTPTGDIFVVRENLDGNLAYFVSSNERWCEKQRGAQAYRQVLDLLADRHWDEIAAAVTAADKLKRPVRRHRTFTWNWIRQYAHRIDTGRE